MFTPLSLTDLGQFGPDARIYCRPAAFVDRPHGLDGRCLRLSDTLLWFSAIVLTVRDATRTAEAFVAVAEWPSWAAAMPDPLAKAAAAQLAALARPRGALALTTGHGPRMVRLGEPSLMGIVNVTPDSFSDGGAFADAAAAIDAGFAMASAGAAIVDVGGESTRPGAKPVWEGDEIKRVEPVVAGLAAGGVAVSIDTRKAAVMEAALAAGASVVNDVSALRHDERALGVVAASSAAVVLMHAPGAGDDPHDGAHYAHPLYDVFDLLALRIAACVEAGIGLDRIIVDPGIGFGKGVGDNLALLGGAALFHALGVPVLVGASRKRLIGALDNEAAADARLAGSLALHYQMAALGVQLLRVHDVPDSRQMLRMWRGLRDAALSGH